MTSTVTKQLSHKIWVMNYQKYHTSLWYSSSAVIYIRKINTLKNIVSIRIFKFKVPFNCHCKLFVVCYRFRIVKLQISGSILDWPYLVFCRELSNHKWKFLTQWWWWCRNKMHSILGHRCVVIGLLHDNYLYRQSNN